MTEHSDSEIAEEVLGYHRMALDGDKILRRQGADWARDMLADFAYDDPGRCWRIIRLAVLGEPAEEALMFFGVTLSGLLSDHPEMIEVIAHDVAETPKLSEVMSWVMEDEAINPSVWARIESLSEPNH